MMNCHAQALPGRIQIQQEELHVHARWELRRPLKRCRDRILRYRRSSDDSSISMREAFSFAANQIPSVIIRRGLMGGNPCIKGTRIPVYMILDGVEYYGNLKGVLKSYPQLTLQQVKDAVRFSKIAMERVT